MTRLPGPSSRTGGRGVEALPRPSTGAVVRSTLMLAAVLVSILIVTHGSLALWNGSAPIASTTVVSGTLTATVAVGDVASATDTTAQFPPTTWSLMFPGESRQSNFTVANTGSTPFELAVSVDATAASEPDVTFAVGPAPCPTDGTGVQTLGAVPVQVGPTQSPGQELTYCLSVTLDPRIAASAQNTTVLTAFTLILTANQATT